LEIAVLIKMNEIRKKYMHSAFMLGTIHHRGKLVNGGGDNPPPHPINLSFLEIFVSGFENLMTNFN
jgi:hypothetical protein